MRLHHEPRPRLFSLTAAAIGALALGAACHALRPRSADVRAPRLGMVVGPRARPEYETMPTPLVYGGGFLNKALVFETLVRSDGNGEPSPGLARSWSRSVDGCSWTFDLRPEARFHSGAPCDASAVREHVLRWLGGVEDAFLPAGQRITGVDVAGPHTVVFHLSEPLDLPRDLAIINPFAVVGPGAARGEETPVLDGTGPWRSAAFEPMRGFRLERNDSYDGERPRSAALELVLYPAASPRDAIGLWALRRGRIDALVEDWVPKIPRKAALKLAEDPRFVLERAPGSATLLLTFNATRAPFSEHAWRARAASAVDRTELILVAEAGLGRPASTVFASRSWPSAAPATQLPPEHAARVEAELLVAESNPEQIRCALVLQEDLRAAGIDLELVFVDGAENDRRLWAGEYDLALAWTWGIPYDPRATLHARFVPQPAERTAVETPPFYTSPELTALVREYLAATTDAERLRLGNSIQSLLSIDHAVVPLYVPERIALRRRELVGLALDGHGYEIDLDRLELTELAE